MKPSDPNDGYKSADAAAIGWAKKYATTSVQDNKELSSTIYEYKNNKRKVRYGFTEADLGEEHTAPLNLNYVPENSKAVGFIHSHGAFQMESDNKFSYQKPGFTMKSYDSKLIAANPSITFYLSVPNGNLLVLKPASPINQNPTESILASGFQHDVEKIWTL